VRYSPDGRYLAMISAADLNDPAAGRLMVAGVGVGQLRDLLPDLEGHVSSFRWRDDDTLVYVADIGTLREVGTVDLDGSRSVLVPASTPILSLQDLADDGTAIFTGDSSQHPNELYSLTPGADEPRRLTSSNDWLDDVRLARQEVVEFEARDGLDLEGVLIYPLDFREGERYPLILTVHGGPESHHNNGWMTSYSRFGQIAAARGFAVFYTNYRGSTGRGVEFSKISQADAAGAEFDDLVDAVDHLIEIGLVDRDRVGIMGGSYGGYASAWGTTYYSDRFAAASPFVGISDNISKVGTTDIPREMYDVHHLKWLWEDWDYFAQRSPIYYVKRNRTPTLILHGAEDPRVHPSQSLELYRHLKVLDQAPVRLVLYPGEGHGNRKSAARLDYTLRVLRWMEHYLKGPGGEPPSYEIDYAEHLPWVESDDESTEGEGTGDESTGS
jgi:dipeptidyl aminopeptidase/acylaminoacyl peptidase